MIWAAMNRPVGGRILTQAAELPLVLEQNSGRALLRELLLLAMPVFAEHVLHILVGWNDTYLANHVHGFDGAATAASRADEVAAGAAVGSISYILWFIGIMVSAVGTGSTAIIARAIGARHRSLANSICGQSISLAILIGLGAGAGMMIFAGAIADATGLHGTAHQYAYQYLRILALSMPLSMLMFVANPCLRGAGDTLTPAITMIVVDVVNMFFSFSMTYGWSLMPRLGFRGIAWGTAIAYTTGGVIQFCVLVAGRGGIRLYLHRMRPHWHNLKRLLRVGLPGGAADLLHWVGNFGVLLMVNQMGAAQGNAHNISIRIESMSYMMGFAVATAATTMVGQSLGMKRPHRAQRSAYIAYALGGGIMTLAGIGFILFGRYPAMMFSDDPQVREMVRQCLFITGFIQCGFAGAFVFGGALRGAGDTLSAMVINTASIFLVRLVGTFVAAKILHVGLAGVWVVLAGELMLRGIAMYARFWQGGWKRVAV